MKDNWILTEARKADKSKDSITLENPRIRKYLDDLLLKRFWPVIRENIEGSMHNYYPHKKPVIESEVHRSLSRSLMFMLFDGDRAFFRGKLTCSVDHWMLSNEFFLSLPQETDPQVVFELIGNSRFSGNPPTLSIDKRLDFYQITLEAGNGAGWGLYEEKYIHGKIAEAIDTNIDMYEFFNEETLSAENLGEFLTIAYKVYEAF
ncbi:MAG: hypothetical protein HY758_05705 [Nitrospirae bacterium]|nr:hypothetical protein [Nitrospirota bacterium]